VRPCSVARRRTGASPATLSSGSHCQTPARTTSVSASLPVLNCQLFGESTLTHHAASAVNPAHALGGYIPFGTFFRIGEDSDLNRPLGEQIIDAAFKLKAKKKIKKPMGIAGLETLASQMGQAYLVYFAPSCTALPPAYGTLTLS
jgi:hypothetical protein